MADDERLRKLAEEHLRGGDPTGWFEPFYASAGGDAGAVPWADQRPSLNLLSWLGATGARGDGRSALEVGCGLGDNAEALAAAGFRVTAFDISPTAIEWCRRRFPESGVEYRVADLLHPPADFVGRFDFIHECYTLQALPPEPRGRAMAALASLLAPGGGLLIVARARDDHEPEGSLPWPLTAAELRRFEELGLKLETFEDYSDDEQPPVRRFRVLYSRPARSA
jgi:SAM-dependent methyltransferase